LFSGTEFNVDRERDLNGVCDFIVSLSSEQLTITSPIISIVEAKNDNVKSGIPQCIAEMVAAQLFNEKEGIPIETVYGVVTTGSNWLFMKLSGHRVEINLNEYYLVQLDKIIGILISVIEDAFAKQK
jgi:phosphoribosylaminoimidazole-succinocarboxamide synthase